MVAQKIAASTDTTVDDISHEHPGPVRGRPSLQERLRRHGSAIFVLALAAAVLGTGAKAAEGLVITAILGLAVVGLSILVGYAGQVSLGQAGIVAIGAYGSAITTVSYGWAPLAGVGAGIVVTMVVAGVTCLLIRLRGLYLALATLALGMLIQILIENLPDLTGGVNGLTGVPYFSVSGLELSDGRSMFVLAAVLVAAAVWLNAGITTSHIGSCLRAIHDDEDAALASGVPVVRYKCMIWIIAALYASIAGSLYAHYIGFVSPGQFGTEMSIILITAVVVGGMTSPLLGLVTFAGLRALPDLLPEDTVSPMLAIGVLLIVFMSQAPTGLQGIFNSFAGLARKVARNVKR
jgi:branched-chain amino acid transport system permease protein